MKSPRTGTEMTRMVRGGVFAWVCDASGGLFVPASAISGLAPGDGAHQLSDQAATMTESPDPRALAPRVQCPQCGERMRRVRRRGVVIDRCDAHGVWLDRGEIQQLLRVSVPPSPVEAEPPPPKQSTTEAVFDVLETVLDLARLFD